MHKEDQAEKTKRREAEREQALCTEILLREGAAGLAVYKTMPGVMRFLDKVPMWAVWLVSIVVSLVTFPVGIVILIITWAYQQQRSIMEQARDLYGSQSAEVRWMEDRERRRDPDIYMIERQWDRITNPEPGSFTNPARGAAPKFGRNNMDRD